MSCLFAEHVAAFLVESLELRVIAWLLGVLPNSWEVGKLSMIPLCHMSPYVTQITVCRLSHMAR